MKAKIISLNKYQKSQIEEKTFVDEYRQLRELMVSLFGPLDHVPMEPEPFDEPQSLEEIG